MTLEWKKRFNPSVILEKLQPSISAHKNGITFSDFDVLDNISTLVSMIKVTDPEMSPHITDVIWKTLSLNEHPISKTDFINHANKELTKYISTTEKTFHLLTSISVSPEDTPKNINILDCKIHFLKHNYPLKFKSRERILKLTPVPTQQTPDSYCKLIITTKAKHQNIATEKSLRAIDLLRAMWCMLCNHEMQYAFGSSKYKPINLIRLGSTHTLHTESGDPACETVWFDLCFLPNDIYKFKNRKTLNDSRNNIKKILSPPYNKTMITSLIRYVRALDECDQNTSFIRLWSALEAMTSNKSDYSQHEKIVSRCSAIFKDREYHKQVLEHLREVRNSNIHRFESSEDTRIHCYQLQLYFKHIYFFHIRNANIFNSLDEANAFLDSILDKKTAERQLFLAKRRLRFLR